MPEPTAVWLVRPGSPDASPGRLSLERGILRFAGTDVTVDVAAVEVRRARRRRGAPILEISYGQDDTLFLFFAEPPPLVGTRPEPGPRFTGRGLERAASAMQLRAESKLLKRTIDEWVGAVRAAG